VSFKCLFGLHDNFVYCVVPSSKKHNRLILSLYCRNCYRKYEEEIPGAPTDVKNTLKKLGYALIEGCFIDK
jgi:hypothetical protein